MIAIFDLEPVVHDLRATATVLGAMITQMQENYTTNEADDYAWRKLESEIGALTDAVVKLWSAAFHEHRDTIDKLNAEHAAALDALRAEKAAPGSNEDLKQVKALWWLLAGAVRVAGESCAEAGYPAPPLLAPKEQPPGFT